MADKQLNAIIYIPYANTNPENFQYRGQHDLTVKTYFDMENNELKEFRGKVDHVMNPFNGIFGNNMAINPFYGPGKEQDKRVIKVRTQKMVFACVRCFLRDRRGKPLTMDEIMKYIEDRNRFLMILQLKQKDLEFEPDLHTEVRSWVDESMRLLNVSPELLTDEEKLLHLPVKTLGIEVFEGDDFENRKQLLFRDCKVVEKKGSLTSLALLVKRVDPYVDPDTRRK